MGKDAAANAVPAGEPSTTLTSRIVHYTFRFLASLLGQITAYAAGVTAAVLGVQRLHQKLNEISPGIPLWISAVILFSPIVLALSTHTIPKILRERRSRRLTEIGGDLKPGYFSLAPRDDEASFYRADNKHEEVLQWIEQRRGRVLYLTGLSGSGKSSLLAAWVLPRLKREDTRIISLRGYQDPVAVLETELTKPGVIWQKAPDEEHGTLPLLERASRLVRPGQLLVVLDQFEECLILQDRERVQRLEDLFSSLRTRPVANLTFLLVFRSDYNGLIGELKLPPLLQEENWKEIPPFTERVAREFIQNSGLKVSDELLRGVLREAAEIEQTKGLIRPVTINLCGLVLGRFAAGVPRGFRPGTLVRGFLRESVTLSTIRDVTPLLLPQLITHSVTKHPRTITEMAQISGLDQPVIRGCMLVLGQSDRAIVRPLDATQETWEISHDFLVPLLDSIIARWSVSLWRRARPLFPWLAAAMLVVILRFSSSRRLAGPQFGQLDVDSTKFYVQHADGAALLNCDADPKCAGLHAFPESLGGPEPTLSLARSWGAEGPIRLKEIQKEGRIVFQAVGSTGNTHGPTDVDLVANSMENDFRGNDRRQLPPPSFFLHLGDVVYNFGEAQYYFDQFYAPYRHYPAPIFAVAGNHDGMVIPGTSNPSLRTFLNNFCASDQPTHRTPEAGASSRTAQIQPGVYFTLDAPYVRILVLYSNTLQSGGVISSMHGKYSELSDIQMQFLEAALTRVKKENFQGAVIIAVHHDPYSAMRESSPDMLADLDAVSKKVGVWPHAVLSGHTHNYQRYTRSVGIMQIPYVVAGNGGNGHTTLSRGVRHPLTPPRLSLDGDHVTLENYDDRGYGYLRIIVDSKKLCIEYHEASGASDHVEDATDSNARAGSDSAADSVTVDLKTRQLVVH